MTTIQAWQHIYSNVEKEQSPQGRGGFQTLFYSHTGLTQAEIEEMEARLLYFPAKQGQPLKRLFFSTGAGKGVVAQITPLDAPDQYGRGGRYLAHSLIFDPADLAQFEADPFRVFNQFSFCGSVDEALAQGDFQTGDIPPVSLSLPATSNKHLVQAAQRWPLPALKQLTLLALRAERQAQQREAITFTGPPETIEQALGAAFLAVPAAWRATCSFDTYFYRCNLVATYFWAVGLPEAPARVKFVQVDASARRLQGQLPQQPETAYERWVLAAIDAEQLALVAVAREPALAVCHWLEGESPPAAQLDEASPALIDFIFEVNQAVVQTAVQRHVAQKLPAALGERAGAELYRRQGGNDLYRRLRQGVSRPELLELLYQSYVTQQFAPPPKAERKALETVLAQQPHGMLQLVSALWDSPTERLPAVLAQASEEDYRRFIQIILPHNWVPAFQLLLPGRASLLLELYTPPPEEIPRLVKKLLELGETEMLTQFTPRLSSLSRRDLEQLTELVDNHPETPPAFQTALAEALAALPPERGLKDMFKSVWRRLPGVD